MISIDGMWKENMEKENSSYWNRICYQVGLRSKQGREIRLASSISRTEKMTNAAMENSKQTKKRYEDFQQHGHFN